MSFSGSCNHYDNLDDQSLMLELLKNYLKELDGWKHILKHHKRKSTGPVQKPTFLFGQHAPYAKAGVGVIDSRMVHRQRIQHLKDLIKSQHLRFDHLMELSIDPSWQSSWKDHDGLPSIVRSRERDFNRVQYEGSFFLFSPLKDVVFASGTASVVKSDEKPL